MFHEMQAEIRTLQNDVEKAKTTNKELIHYTEHLQRAPQDYKGKDIYSSKEKVKDFEDCHDKSSDSTVVCYVLWTRSRVYCHERSQVWKQTQCKNGQ